MTFKLKEARESSGMTQEELAEKSGVSRVTISLIESGKATCVKTNTLCRLANALNKKSSELFF